jgi:hypothetical protein
MVGIVELSQFEDWAAGGFKSQTVKVLPSGQETPVSLNNHSNSFRDETARFVKISPSMGPLQPVGKVPQADGRAMLRAKKDAQDTSKFGRLSAAGNPASVS